MVNKTIENIQILKQADVTNKKSEKNHSLLNSKQKWDTNKRQRKNSKDHSLLNSGQKWDKSQEETEKKQQRSQFIEQWAKMRQEPRRDRGKTGKTQDPSRQLTPRPQSEKKGKSSQNCPNKIVNKVAYWYRRQVGGSGSGRILTFRQTKIRTFVTGSGS